MKYVKVTKKKVFKKMLKPHGNDFWLSCLSDNKSISLKDRVQIATIMGKRATEVFTHCIIWRVKNMRAAAQQLAESRGMGLRKTKLQAATEGPGRLFAFVKDSGFSEVSKSISAMDANDKRLSVEERVRRSTIVFKVVTEEQLLNIARQPKHKDKGWLTTFTKIWPEACKGRVVGMKINGESVDKTFKSCLIAGVENCWQAARKMERDVGTSLRTQRTKAQSAQGCLVLLLKTQLEEAQAPSGMESLFDGAAVDDDLVAQDVGQKRKASGSASQGEKTPSKKKKKDKKSKTDDSEMRIPLAELAVQASREESAQDSPAAAPVTRAGGEGATTAQDKRKAVKAEDRYMMQTRVLEKKLKEILPDLPKKKLTASLVQAKLEEVMCRPAGRFDKFRMDIARIWRAFEEEQRKKALLRGQMEAAAEMAASDQLSQISGSPPQSLVEDAGPTQEERLKQGAALLGINEDELEKFDELQQQDQQHESIESLMKKFRRGFDFDIGPEAREATLRAEERAKHPTTPWGQDQWPKSWPSLQEDPGDSAAVMRLRRSVAHMNERKLKLIALKAAGPIAVDSGDDDSPKHIPRPLQRHRQRRRLEERTRAPPPRTALDDDFEPDLDEEPVRLGTDIAPYEDFAPYEDLQGHSPAVGSTTPPPAADDATEVDEFGFEMAMDRLQEAAEAEDAASVLQMLIRCRPAEELLGESTWQKSLVAWHDAQLEKKALTTELAVLVRRLQQAWCRLAGNTTAILPLAAAPAGQHASAAAPASPAVADAAVAASAEQASDLAGAADQAATVVSDAAAVAAGAATYGGCASSSSPSLAVGGLGAESAGVPSEPKNGQSDVAQGEAAASPPEEDLMLRAAREHLEAFEAEMMGLDLDDAVLPPLEPTGLQKNEKRPPAAEELSSHIAMQAAIPAVQADKEGDAEGLPGSKEPAAASSPRGDLPPSVPPTGGMDDAKMSSGEAASDKDAVPSSSSSLVQSDVVSPEAETCHRELPPASEALASTLASFLPSELLASEGQLQAGTTVMLDDLGLDDDDLEDDDDE
eukprot:TRINITY_DN21258_c0_g1_i1.p1 TRINITY_DN21258_c0_g1~~TRINITY_DN21258_c0_g1_i1.p1  ORF type:complete len:1041 (+),score=338.51 TRINITY_DN21258_c0_g1_i1:113-3235(+)